MRFIPLERKRRAERAEENWREAGGGRLKRERKVETRLAQKVSSTESRGGENRTSRAGAPVEGTGEASGRDERQTEENSGLCSGAQMKLEKHMNEQNQYLEEGKEEGW